MAFKDPFARIKTFDEKAFLRVNLRNFLELEARPEQFYSTINELQAMRGVLSALNEAGTLADVSSGFGFYKEAVNWLRLNNPINSGYPVSAITAYDDINDSIASGFQQYVTWFRSNYLANQQIYQTFAAQIGAAKADKLNNLELEADKYIDEFRQSLYDAQQGLASASDARTEQLSGDLGQKFNEQIQQVYQATSRALNNIKQAQSLTIWHEAYEANIALYSDKLNGKSWKTVEVKNRWKNFRTKLTTLNLDINVHKDIKHFNISESRKEAKLIGYIVTRLVRFIFILSWHILTYLFSNLVLSLRAQRMIWFSVLGLVLIGQSLIFLVFLVKGTLRDLPFNDFVHGNLINTLASNEYVFAKISIFIGLILVPSLGYAFANRNYRIYANILEQYRHRATVAQTIQGILRYVDESESNKDIRVSLATVAAVAMFEMKNVGHLSKRDGDTLPTGEVLQAIMPR